MTTHTDTHTHTQYAHRCCLPQHRTGIRDASRRTYRTAARQRRRRQLPPHCSPSCRKICAHRPRSETTRQAANHTIFNIHGIQKIQNLRNRPRASQLKSTSCDCAYCYIADVYGYIADVNNGHHLIICGFYHQQRMPTKNEATPLKAMD